MNRLLLLLALVSFLSFPNVLPAGTLTNADDVVRAVKEQRYAEFCLRGTIADISTNNPWTFYLSSGDRCLLMFLADRTKKNGKLHSGDLVEVSGFLVSYDTGFPRVPTSYHETVLAHGEAPPYVPATVGEILAQKLPTPRIRTEGTVTKLFRDPLYPEYVMIEISDRGQVIYVVFAEQENTAAPLPDLLGTRIAVKGRWNLSSYGRIDKRLSQIRGQVNGTHVSIPGRGAIEVLRGPPWWTRERLGWVILALTGALVLLSGWTLFLRMLARTRLGERTRLATELHDYLSQNLTAISYRISTARKARATDPADADENLLLAERMMSSCRTEMRRCLWDLRNNALDCDNLGNGIRASIGPLLNGVHCTVNVNVPRRHFDDTAAHDVLSIVRELVANAISHGGCSRLAISSTLGKGRGTYETLTITIRDNGCGFNPDAVDGPGSGHLGLSGVRERAKRHHGEIKLTSAPGEGTVVTVKLETSRK